MCYSQCQYLHSVPSPSHITVSMCLSVVIQKPADDDLWSLEMRGVLKFGRFMLAQCYTADILLSLQTSYLGQIEIALCVQSSADLGGATSPKFGAQIFPT